jgi:hypothetical protein
VEVPLTLRALSMCTCWPGTGEVILTPTGLDGDNVDAI